jgi:hypothetical protein
MLARIPLFSHTYTHTTESNDQEKKTNTHTHTHLGGLWVVSQREVNIVFVQLWLLGPAVQPQRQSTYKHIQQHSPTFMPLYPKDKSSDPLQVDIQKKPI